MAKEVTSIVDLEKYKNGSIIELPSFGEGQPFVARVRRPSMLKLAKNGQIPNSLLAAAGEMFTRGSESMDVDNPQLLADLYDVCRIMAEATLIEPSLADIESAGLELTDDQLMALFNFSQAGVQALEPFREE